MTDEPDSHVKVENTRDDDQRRVYEEIAKAGVCPFCEEHIPKHYQGKVLSITTHWIIAENAWPYANAESQYNLIVRRHITNIDELSEDEKSDWWTALTWLLEYKDIQFGAFLMRFGSTAFTTASVSHLHGQLIVPDLKAEDKVRIPIGPSRKRKK